MGFATVANPHFNRLACHSQAWGAARRSRFHGEQKTCNGPKSHYQHEPTTLDHADHDNDRQITLKELTKEVVSVSMPPRRTDRNR